jgi:tetratricopeptide (TPR) repeat protein
MKQLLLRLTFLLWLSILGGADPASQNDFTKANELCDQQRYQEALPLYIKSLEQYPDQPAVIWNTAVAAQLCQQWELALQAWKSMQKLEPDNWKIQAKLIQVYQGMDKVSERDQQRADLLAYQKANPLKVKEPSFCRDQFEVAGKRVLAFENFDFSGPRRVRYTFRVANLDTGEKDFLLSLGSYDFTTEFAKRSGEIKADQRIYHLDYYAKGEHRTYAFAPEEPSYETTKQWIGEILAGTRKPITSSSSAPSEKTPQNQP